MPWLGMAKSGSERTKAWRAELVAQGYKQKALLLPPEALRDLKKLKERLDASDAEAVTIALRELAKRGNR